jgi:hypothetical protein
MQRQTQGGGGDSTGEAVGTEEARGDRLQDPFFSPWFTNVLHWHADFVPPDTTLNTFCGCCGNTTEHVRAIRRELNAWSVRPRRRSEYSS